MQMDVATTPEAVNDIMDEPAYSSIINSCGWPSTKPITLSTKAEFIARLIHHEVIFKRSVSIASFRDGLSVLRMKEAFKKNSRVLRPLLAYSGFVLTSKSILDKVKWDEMNEEKERAHDFFIRYLEEMDGGM